MKEQPRNYFSICCKRVVLYLLHLLGISQKMVAMQKPTGREKEIRCIISYPIPRAILTHLMPKKTSTSRGALAMSEKRIPSE